MIPGCHGEQYIWLMYSDITGYHSDKKKSGSQKSTMSYSSRH